MKTNNEYQIFLKGYLEALTDIDGEQREFGVYVRMFNFLNQNYLLDTIINNFLRHLHKIIHKHKHKEVYKEIVSLLKEAKVVTTKEAK